LVSSVVGNAERRLGLDVEQLAEQDLERLVDDAMVGLKLFVPEQELPHLTAELDAILQSL
jgi:hypothetical protein